MAKPETVYGISVLLTADETLHPAVKLAMLDLLEKGIKAKDHFFKTHEAVVYCSVSRTVFYRHVKPLCKPIKIGKRIVRYSIIDLDRVLKTRNEQGVT